MRRTTFSRLFVGSRPLPITRSPLVGLVADINTARMRMHHLQTEVFRLDFPRHLPSLLAVHLVPTGRLRTTRGGCVFFLLLLRLFFPELHALLVLVAEFNLARP